MHDLGPRPAVLGVAHVVRQREVADLAAIRVAALRLTQVHAPTRLTSIPCQHKHVAPTRVPTVFATSKGRRRADSALQSEFRSPIDGSDTYELRNPGVVARQKRLELAADALLAPRPHHGRGA